MCRILMPRLERGISIFSGMEVHAIFERFERRERQNIELGLYYFFSVFRIS